MRFQRIAWKKRCNTEVALLGQGVHRSLPEEQEGSHPAAQTRPGHHCWWSFLPHLGPGCPRLSSSEVSLCACALCTWGGGCHQKQKVASSGGSPWRLSPAISRPFWEPRYILGPRRSFPLSIANILPYLGSLGGYNFTPGATGLQNWKVVLICLQESPLTSFSLRNRANFQGTFYFIVTVALRAGNTDFVPVTTSSPKPPQSLSQVFLGQNIPAGDAPPSLPLSTNCGLSVSLIILWDQSLVLSVPGSCTHHAPRYLREQPNSVLSLSRPSRHLTIWMCV